FHGTSPFDIDTAQPISAPAKSFTEVFSSKIVSLAAKDERITAITAAMPEGTGLARFEETFPKRFFNVGMAEGHAVGFAAGLARKGLLPIVAIYSSFLQRSYDQIIHDVCLQNLHVIFCLDRGGVVGEDGPTHHGVFDISYMRHIPNLVCMAPKDLHEMEDMLEFATAHKGPISIRYPRGGILESPIVSNRLPEGRQDIALGRAETLRAGKDIAILAIGDMAGPALEAADLLSEKNIQAEVVNMRFIKPIDHGIILTLAKRIKKLVVVEDNVLEGGFGSAVLEVLDDHKEYGAEVVRIGLPDEFIRHAKRSELLEEFGLSAKGIANSVNSFQRLGLWRK
ncbi:MAG: 1-deoxy-D-xylulose-5-phosphate synthase, partial [Candidatus Omnitrophica bacterium]|nr:1-deoxy-D-xylulose-5-phosphate synthase [Candidatus Omnitrophota bacterium]